MTYDPNDFQDQAALAAILQRQKLINAQNRQLSIPENRKCPWCGGELLGQYSKCQHCASDVCWVDNYPCKPQEAEYKRKEIARKIKNEKKRREAINARVVNCKKCGCNVPQSSLETTIDTCDKCNHSSCILFILVIIAVVIFIACLCCN